MLASEMVSPIQLSYESMNDTMLNFLLKFYDLKNYILQTEGLLVFEGFFEVSSLNLFSHKITPTKIQE